MHKTLANEMLLVQRRGGVDFGSDTYSVFRSTHIPPNIKEKPGLKPGSICEVAVLCWPSAATPFRASNRRRNIKSPARTRLVSPARARCPSEHLIALVFTLPKHSSAFTCRHTKPYGSNPLSYNRKTISPKSRAFQPKCINCPFAYTSTYKTC